MSCSNDSEVLTSGQIIGKELEQIIRDNNVDRFEHRTVDFPDGGLSSIISEYEINDEFIRLRDYWYNLNYLAYYEVYSFQDDSGSHNKLILYFEY